MNRSKGLLPDRWFDDVDPRGDIEAIRSALATRMDAGVPSTAVVRALAERDRVVVAELLIGPRAGQGSTWTFKLRWQTVARTPSRFESSLRNLTRPWVRTSR